MGDGEGLPEAPDMEPVEVEVTIRDDAYTHEEYTTRLMLTQRELEAGDPEQIARMATEQTLDSAVRSFREQLRGTDGGPGDA